VNKKAAVIVFLLVLYKPTMSQFLMDMVDTSKDIGKGMLSIYQKFDRVRFSGYIQPQFQYIEQKGGKTFNGGDFPEKSNNRFMLRRGRIRVDYIHFAEKTGPSVQFVFQFDGTERGVFIRDFWGRIFENKFHLFAFTAGMFARPFSYELNLSSSDRESPERGRMSQLLMKTERDMGAMISIDPKTNNYLFKNFKLDVGLFNGPGLSAPADFDSHKDFISRLALKPINLSAKIIISAAASYLNGGFIQNTKYVYHTKDLNGIKNYSVDSSASNENGIAPRKYYGADLQLKFHTKAGFIELRAEAIAGKQTATHLSSETPAVLLTGTDGYYTRHFSGAYFYFLFNIISSRHQLGIKYDWYDPNTAASKNDIGKIGSNLNAADIKYSTLGFGYNFYMNPNVKLLIWYDLVRNEKTLLTSYATDIKDDVLTCRLQFRF
jgi:hypothetical protein